MPGVFNRTAQSILRRAHRWTWGGSLGLRFAWHRRQARGRIGRRWTWCGLLRLRFAWHRRQASGRIVRRWAWGGSLASTLRAQRIACGPGQGGEDAAAPRGRGLQFDHLGGPVAVEKIDLAAAGAARGRPGAGALPAMETATAVPHGQLAAGMAGAGLGAAARGSGIVARGIAMLQATVARGGGPGISVQLACPHI